MRQIGMDHESEMGKVYAARCDIGRDADPGASVAQGLQGLIALVLAEFTREDHGGKAALDQDRVQVAHRIARVAEHECGRGFSLAEQVHNALFDGIGFYKRGPMLDIRMPCNIGRDLDPRGIALEARSECDDPFGQCR